MKGAEQTPGPAATLTSEGVLSSASALLALGAVATLPWPGLVRGNELIWVSWALLEMSWLLSLLPGLLAGAPPVVRASVREAQIGACGRAVLWLALGALAILVGGWQLIVLPGRILGIAAAAFALPVALGWGPFAPLPGWPSMSADAGLPPSVVRLQRAAYAVRAGGLILATVLIALPLPLPAPIAVGSVIALASVVVLGGWRLHGAWPRLTLDAALRHCMGRAFPLGIAAIIYAAALASVVG